MNWRVVIRPEVEQDVVEAAVWYESREALSFMIYDSRFRIKLRHAV